MAAAETGLGILIVCMTGRIGTRTWHGVLGDCSKMACLSTYLDAQDLGRMMRAVDGVS